jgi:signal transduction histidine kinase
MLFMSRLRTALPHSVALLSSIDSCRLRGGKEVRDMRHDIPYGMSISRLSDGVFVEASKGFADSFGLKEKKVIGRSALPGDLNCWADREERALLIDALEERGELTERDLGLRRHNAVLVLAKIIRLKGEAYLLCVYRNTAAGREEVQDSGAYQEKLKELSSQLSLVEEKERRRIAAAIHDYIGQSLAFAHLKLQSLQEMPLTGEAKKSLGEANTMIELCLQYARSITSDLSPAVLYELGFEAAVEWQVDQLQGQYGLTYRIKTEGALADMDNEIRIVLFRSVRELLANVVKHAKARHVLITLQRYGARALITVADDGNGFKEGAARSSKGFGLFNIREQLSYIGGVLTIASRSGQGTIVKIEAPLRKAAAKSAGAGTRRRKK